MVELRNPRMNGNDLVDDIKVVEGTVPQAAGAAVLFIDIFGIWRRHIRRGQLLARLWGWTRRRSDGSCRLDRSGRGGKGRSTTHRLRRQPATHKSSSSSRGC